MVVGGLAMLVAFTLGTGLCANVFALELVGRMNTVFKFWFESWIVLSAGNFAAPETRLPGSRPGRFDFR